MDSARANPFEAFHPLVPVVYLSAVIVFAMAAVHPVYVALSLAGAVAAACLVRGPARAFGTLGFSLVFAAVVAAGNLVFVAQGSTELFRIGERAFYAEALGFGLVMGGMFAAMLMWFSVWSAVLDGEALLAVFGRRAPTVALIVTQVMRLTRQFVRRGRSVRAAQDAAFPPASLSKRDRLRLNARIASVLMGWGMEDGIVRSDAMRARGYECGIPRTLYRRVRFRGRDGVALAVICLLVALSGLLAGVACSQYAFYPTASRLVAWWGYAPYVALMAVPAVLSFKESAQWQLSK